MIFVVHGPESTQTTFAARALAVATLTWLLVAYFTWQAVLWGTDRMRDLDERTILGGAVSVTPDGALAASVAEPLICYKDLRVSMAVMTVGMAYMFAAMQLVMS